MAAYRRVYDSRHLQADCQEPGSAPEPHARQSSMRYLYLFHVADSVYYIGVRQSVRCRGRSMAGDVGESVSRSFVVQTGGVALSASRQPASRRMADRRRLPSLAEELRPSHRRLDLASGGCTPGPGGGHRRPSRV